jgi:hypothetical protein
VTQQQQSEVDLARIEALRGNAEAALCVLARHAAAGDDSAAASSAELSAYLWRWDDVVAQAARLIANPHAVYAGNVFHELVRLLGRAGRETGDWRSIARVADAAHERVEADLQKNPWGFPKTRIEGATHLLLTTLDRLGEYALGEGHIRLHGDIDIFSPKPAIPRPDLFDSALKLKQNQKSDARRLVFACLYHLDDEMIRLSSAMDGRVGFDRALPIAKAFLRRNDPAMAWQMLRGNWADWAPVDRAQTTPLAFLIDGDFAGLVTKDRAMELVHIGRGGYPATDRPSGSPGAGMP